MSESDAAEDFDQFLEEIQAEKPNLSENEQNFVDAWITKIRELDEDEREIRNEYIALLRSQLNREIKHLSMPYLQMPPEARLPRLEELMNSIRRPEKALSGSTERRRYLCAPPEQKPPCRPKTVCTRVPERIKKSNENAFENPEEMARCIARSKGITLPEFVMDISRHTSDKGFELRSAMKAETVDFNEYVERIMSQRLKDLGDLMDHKQGLEQQKIQKDIDKWQSELSICKKRIKEMVPDFDLEAYRRDKNYLKRMFTVDTSHPPVVDKFKEWKEENCHRLLWFVEEIDKFTEENNQVSKEINEMKEKIQKLEELLKQRQQCHDNYMRIECTKYQNLKQRSDKLAREIADLIVSLKN